MTNWEKKILRIVRKQNPDDPINYVRNIVKAYAREKLDNQILQCSRCKMMQGSTRSITYGDINAPIMVITDTALPSLNAVTRPIENVEQWGIVTFALSNGGASLKDCFFINAVNCCPQLVIDHNVIYRIVPNLEEKEHCRPYLLSAIEIVKPKCIIILGNIALNSLIKANLNAVRGKVLDVMGIPTVTTFNPRYLLLCKKETPDIYECETAIFLNDIKKAISIAKS